MKSGTDSSIVLLRKREQQFWKDTIPQSSQFARKRDFLVFIASTKEKPKII
jgi:hypothetical protein